MNHDQRNKSVLLGILGALVLFLVWWWWPRGEASIHPQPLPMPPEIAKKGPPKAPVGEPAQFEEVKLPNGEVGFAPRLSVQQEQTLQKKGRVTLSVPGGTITITDPDGNTKK